MHTPSDVKLLTYALEVLYDANESSLKDLTEPDERYERNDLINQNQAIIALKEKLCKQQ